MNELLDKLENLKKELDKNENIIQIRKLNELISNNQELLSLIKEYQIRKDEKIKKEIYENEQFREYKHLENEINFMILEIRESLKKISNKGSCGR